MPSPYGEPRRADSSRKALCGEASLAGAVQFQEVTVASEERLPRRSALAYALPYAGYTWFQMLFTQYIFKYSVDVLLIGPAVIGQILFITRMWDAVSDPMVGYLSDRTRSRWGRRRPWVFACAIPVALTTFLMWNPPQSLDEGALLIWMFIAVLLWETAMTTFALPYMGLGSEITLEHNDRTRISGYRYLAGGLGNLSVVGCVYLLTHSDSPRDLTTWMIPIGCVFSVALTWIGMYFVRERPDHTERRARKFWRSLSGVMRSRHLLLLLVIYFFDVAGIATLGLLGGFLAHYVLGDARLFWQLLLAYQLAGYASTPLVVWLSSHLGKRQVWILALLTQAAGFAATYLAGPGDGLFATACLVVVGLGSSASSIVGMSILGDVTDYDECRGGERREATHYAAINIARKISFASLSWFVGVMMMRTGYEANAVQSEAATEGIRWLFAGMPALASCFAIGALLLFRLNKKEHARIRMTLDERHRDEQREVESNSVDGH
jgi:GPH family glycoside/pentoside/hexuronide:cation symporter